MDLDKCLEILRNRPVCGGGGGGGGADHDHPHHQQQLDDAAPRPPPMGQVIELVPGDDDGEEEEEGQEGEAAAAAAGGPPTTADADAAGLSPEARAGRSVAKLREGLKGLDLRGLVKAFTDAQEERARAYAAFDAGLASVLARRAFDDYTAVCAEATASFAALSNLVNAVVATLEEEEGEGVGPKKKEEEGRGVVVAALLRRVQGEEKEKLSLTAALHLERFRLATSTCSGAGGCNEAAAGTTTTTTTTTTTSVGLLREGVKALEGRLGAVKGRINEALEELRYEVAAAEEEEE